MRGMFEDKVALITGGSSGIGRAAGMAFGREGARVVIVARNAQNGGETVEMIKNAGGEAIFIQADVSRENEVAAMVEKTVAAFGGLDCAFNNAACDSKNMPTAHGTEKMFLRTMSVDLVGVWLCMKYEILHMRKQGGGTIVNTASINALGFTVPGAADYTAAKCGVVGLSKTAQLEYAKEGIRINVVCPGPTRTPLLEGFFEKKPEAERWVRERTPAGRIAEPEEIAAAVIWLSSDSASFVYGSILPVDGGILLS